MKALAKTIEETVETYAAQFRLISDAELERKPAPDKWSKKEILGHLCDSAQNNIQRLVRGQYERDPKIAYAQDEWVRIQKYQDYNRSDLLQFWILLNKHFCSVIRAMDVATYERKCDVGSDSPEEYTLKFIAEDYLRHLRHHLVQIADNSR